MKKETNVKEFLMKYGFVIILILVTAFFGITTNNFITVKNLFSILHNAAPVFAFCVGAAMVIMSGMVDLSIGSTMYLSAAIGTILIVRKNVPIILALLAVAAICIIIGIINGLVIDKFDMSPMIATMATMIVIRGLAQYITNSVVISLPDYLRKLNSLKIGGIYIDIFIAAIVLFQPELRRTLERMGQSTMWANRLFGTHRRDPSLRAAWQSAVVAICDAAEQLSDTRTGALLVLERNNNLDEIIRTGTPMHADVIPEMLGTIFYEGTPLHDGAVVIRDGVIVAAGCVLPLSNNLEMGKDMGTRHRAGLGMSENSDAIVVIVSEETGIISMAKNGVLIRRLDRQNLFNLLQEEIVPPAEDEAENTSPLQKLLRKGGALNYGKSE